MMHQTNTPVAEEVDNPDYRIKGMNARRLWSAVMFHALKNACVAVMRGDRRPEARMDVDYFMHPGRDFREVATLAGLDPEGVAERCKEILSCPEKAKTAYQSLVRISDDEE